MCGGGGGGSNAALEYQKKQDRLRRQRIQQGMQRIEDIFEGYTTYPEREAAWQRVTDTVAAGGVPDFLQDEARHYNGAVHNPSLPDTYAEFLQGLGDDFRDIYYDQFLDANDFQGVYHPGFNEDFYDQRAQAYTDFALPQLQRQYEEAQDALQLGLVSQGLTGSSIAAERQANLERRNQKAVQGIAQRAQGYANKARRAVANERQALVNALQASADPSVINVSATRQSLMASPEFAALGDVFGNLTQGFAGYVAGRNAQDAVAETDDLFKLPSNYGGSGKVYT